MKEEKNNLIIDIDDTLLITNGYQDNYSETKPIQREIDLVNKAYKLGYNIILWTSRHWVTYNLTKKQLKKLGVQYHELIMGKPMGDYVDATHNYKSLGEIL